MKLLRHALVASLALFMLPVFAQDIHFTQFNMSPLTLNPANTGAFNGSVRLGGIFRDQWNYIGAPKGYRTPSFFVDAPLPFLVRKRDWIGVGVSVYQDVAGTGKLTTGNAGISAAYHLALKKDYSSVLTVGAQYGFNQRRLADKNALTTETSIVNGSDPELMGLSTQGTNYSDLAAGVGFKTALNKKMGLELGFSMGHLMRPKYGILGTASVARQPIRSTLHGTFNMNLSDKLSLHPAFLFQTMAGTNEIALQAVAGYKLKPESTTVLRGGLGYRMRDAAKFLVGIDMGKLRVGAAYDLNLSDLSPVTNNHGGFELAANYIITIRKRPVVPPVILCPHF